MPDTKITALTAIGANPIIPATFPIPMVDLTDTSMAASGTTKKVTVNQILGSGGTATLASATITGAATVGTTLGVTGASTLTGNVAVGTTSSPWLTGVKALDIGSSGLAAYSGGITHNAYYDNTDSRWEYKGTGAATFYNPQNGVHQWFVAASGIANNPITTFATPAMELTATGNLAFPTGKGIDFSATTSGSGTMTSELLNDYEEGNWTGTIGGTTSNPTTPVTSTGRYTKIGRQVSIQIAFLAVDTTGASSRILVTGLPFAASSSPNGITGSVLIDAMATFTGSPGVYLTSSSTQIDLYSSVSNGAIASVTHNAGAAKSLWLNVTYSV